MAVNRNIFYKMWREMGEVVKRERQSEVQTNLGDL
jgi:hypothetical protein